MEVAAELLDACFEVDARLVSDPQPERPDTGSRLPQFGNKRRPEVSLYWSPCAWQSRRSLRSAKQRPHAEITSRVGSWRW